MRAGCRLVFLLGIALSNRLATAAEPHLEVIRVDSPALKGNALHDPAVRHLAVFFPSAYESGKRWPIVYYLPGYGNSSENFIRSPAEWLALTRKVADDGEPMLIVVVDGLTKWGGSQYLNSPAQGNYADFVCQEAVAAIEARYPAPASGMRRIIGDIRAAVLARFDWAWRISICSTA